MSGVGMCNVCDKETQPRMLCTCPNRLPNGDWIRVRVGQIYEAHTDFLATHDSHEKLRALGRKCQFFIHAGERIEIRYPYEWHFRTEDNVYLQADEKTLLTNCKLVGTIWDTVRSGNRASLEEILRIGLYDKAV